MHHDLTKLARDMRDCHQGGRPFRLPAMKVCEMGLFLRICESWMQG